MSAQARPEMVWLWGPPCASCGAGQRAAGVKRGRLTLHRMAWYCRARIHSAADCVGGSTAQRAQRAQRTCSPGNTEKLMGPSRSYWMGLPFLSVPCSWYVCVGGAAGGQRGQVRSWQAWGSTPDQPSSRVRLRAPCLTPRVARPSHYSTTRAPSRAKPPPGRRTHLNTLAVEDHGAAGAPQALVGGRRHDVGVLKGRGHEARRHQAADVGHIRQQDRVVLVCGRGQRRWAGAGGG